MIIIHYVLKIAHRVPAIFVATALFLLLLGLTVSCLFSFKPLYTIGFERHGVSAATGITSEGLEEVADAFVAYFRSDDEYIEVIVDVYGAERAIFSHKEIIHMRDVKELVNGFRNFGGIALVVLMVYVLAMLYRMRSQAIPILARRLSRSALAIMIAAIVCSVLVAVAFPVLFTIFHLVSFSNDYWLLDPRQDYLVMLFTTNFFLEATGLLIGLIFLECGFLIGVSYALRLRHR